MEFTLRPATSADVPSVIELVSHTLSEFGIAFGEGTPTDEQLKGLPKSYHDETGEFFVALFANQLVGTAGVVSLGDGIFELRKMYLRPVARGSSVAPALLEACIQHCRKHHAKALVLDTTIEMKRAIAFYERNGFVRDDSQIRSTRCSRGYRLDL